MVFNQSCDLDFISSKSSMPVCYECHSEKKEEFDKKYMHEGVETGECLKCHKWHGLTPKLELVKEVPELCISCHSSLSNHNKYPVLKSKCQTCHNPHASDNEKFLNDFQHQPFQDKECDSCHQGLDTPEPLKLNIAKNELCYECHDDKKEEFQTNNTHKPVSEGNCTGCHNPHVSVSKSLVKYSQPKLCLNCHADFKEYLKVKYTHKPVIENCQNCHKPHYGKK